MSIDQGSAFNNNPAADEETCFPWRLARERSNSVSVATLKVPPKAREDYAKACEASNKNKYEEAEQHARSAIDKFRDYLPGWVMLGIILEEQNKPQEARDACSRAAAIDAAYLPAYLCAAEMSARSREWKDVLSSADLALGLKSEHDLYPHYYRAMAYLHLNNLAEARKDALDAVQADVNHDEPLLHLLLAEIYERESDSQNAVIQLQQFLQHPTDRKMEEAARQRLAKLEARQPSK